MGMCDCRSGKVDKPNQIQDAKLAAKFIKAHAVITTRDCDEWEQIYGRPENNYEVTQEDIDTFLAARGGLKEGEQVVQRPEEFWCIDKDTGVHIMAEWVRNARNFLPDEVLYYRIHESRVSQVLGVYDEVANMWAECTTDYSEHTPLLRETFRPAVPEEQISQMSSDDIIKVANCGFAELIQVPSSEE